MLVCIVDECVDHTGYLQAIMATAKGGVYAVVTFERLSPLPPSFCLDLQRHIYMYNTHTYIILYITLYYQIALYSITKFYCSLVTNPIFYCELALHCSSKSYYIPLVSSTTLYYQIPFGFY